MHSATSIRALVLGLLLLVPAASGCGKGAGTTRPDPTLDQATADDIAISGAATAEMATLDMMGALGAATLSPAPAAPAGAAPTTTQWDTSFVVGGIHFEASATFYDALGNPLPQYDPSAARLAWTSRVYGEAASVRDTLTIGRAAVLQVRGLHPLQDTLRVDATALDTLTNRFRSLSGNVIRYFYVNGSTVIDGVTLLKSSLGSAAWPLSGSMTFNLRADRLRTNNRADVERHFVSTVVVIFNGTSQPEIVIDYTWHYRWNMVTGTVTRA